MAGCSHESARLSNIDEFVRIVPPFLRYTQQFFRQKVSQIIFLLFVFVQAYFIRKKTLQGADDTNTNKVRHIHTQYEMKISSKGKT